MSRPTSTLPLADAPRTATAMYDVGSGDKTSKTNGAAGAFIVLAPISLFFMMWWGYGGYTAIALAGLHSLFVQIPIYLWVELLVVQCMFFWATRTTRKGALYGFLSPWVIVILVSVPQFFDSPGEVLLFVLVPALGFASNAVVERTFHNGGEA